MARVKLNYPGSSIFETDLEIRIDDINYGGHVGNDRYLTLAQEVRYRFFRELGFKDEASIQDKKGIIVTDAVVVYKAEVFLGDTLHVELCIDDHNKYGFDFYYRMINQKNKVCSIIKTGIVGFDYDAGSIAEIPQDFMDRINELK